MIEDYDEGEELEEGVFEECAPCNGTGMIGNHLCSACEGRCYVEHTC